MTASASPGQSELDQVALGKLTRVLGEPAGRRVFEETLRSMGVRRLDTAEDLYTFATAVSGRGGMVSAVGGLLSVAAVMRGASGKR